MSSNLMYVIGAGALAMIYSFWKSSWIEKQDEGYKIVIKKNGIVPVPLKLKIILDDETEDEIYHTAAVWENGINTFTMNYETDKIISKVILGDESIPDSFDKNNSIKLTDE